MTFISTKNLLGSAADEALAIAGFEDFGTELKEIYEDVARLQALSSRSREVIRDHYSVDAARKAVIGDFAGE